MIKKTSESSKHSRPITTRTNYIQLKRSLEKRKRGRRKEARSAITLAPKREPAQRERRNTRRDWISSSPINRHTTHSPSSAALGINALPPPYTPIRYLLLFSDYWNKLNIEKSHFSLYTLYNLPLAIGIYIGFITYVEFQ